MMRNLNFNKLWQNDFQILHSIYRIADNLLIREQFHYTLVNTGCIEMLNFSNLMGEFWTILLLLVVVWSSFCFCDNNWDWVSFHRLRYQNHFYKLIVLILLNHFYGSVTFLKLVFVQHWILANLTLSSFYE